MTIDQPGPVATASGPPQPSPAKPPPSVQTTTRATLAAVAGLAALLLAAIMILNGGAFSYALDDPYIHLALSKFLLRLHHGLWPGELCSPSSSILYPWLLAPAALSPGFHLYWPLLLNGLCLAATAAAVVRLLDACRLPGWPLATMVVVTFHLVGLVFSGMEHSAHILVSLAALLGVIRFLDHDRIPWWLLAAIVVGPLLRFEGLGISVAALAALVWRRRFGPAALAAALLTAALGLYGWSMVRLGLPALPSSVLLKSILAEQAVSSGSSFGLVWALLLNLKLTLSRIPSLSLWLLLLLAAARPLTRRPRPGFDHPETVLAGFVVLATAAHLAAGQYGWFNRYEVYVLVVAALGTLRLWRDALAPIAALPWGWTTPAILLLTVGYPYLLTTLTTPLAAANIFSQQQQMARFVTDYWPEPVAVNDIGLLSYRSPAPVIDLVGLSSEEVRRARRDHQYNPAFVADLLARHRVTLVMLYPDLVKPWGLPEWIEVARLRLDQPRITPGDDAVVFLATDLTDRPRLIAQLRRFQATLPWGASLELTSDGQGPPPHTH